MVALDARGISIDGRYTVLLCSSLFYFRIPEGLWEDRMRKLKSAGYNAIDVYFPWNFHEQARDVWDFGSGMRDVETFLAGATRHGLYVVARPGPYICSEWDGGALPAYLQADGLDIRQNDDAYLARVREWYRRILPIVARHQVGAGGTVILLQIENELDFYDCRDPAGYLGALRDMARGAGITVPLFACAGQGDLEGAWGGVGGVAPSLNLYLDSRMPGLESGIAPYVEHLGRLGYPLMVTETGRDILLLRRLLASGAKLLGPYNQVGGYDFGFSSGVNNWGSPLSFQTTHYSFSSLVDSFGHLREDAFEHRALAGLLETLGPLLASSRPCSQHEITVQVDGQPVDVPALELGTERGNGYLLAVSNPGPKPIRVRFLRAGARLPADGPLVVAPVSSTFVLFDLPLSTWGLEGTLLFSTAEPFSVRGGPRPVATFQAAAAAEVHYDLGDGPRVFRFSGQGTEAESVPTPAGGTLTLRGIARAGVMAEDGAPGSAPSSKRSTRPLRGRPLGATLHAAPRLALRWVLRGIDHDELFPPGEGTAGAPSLHMERHGGLRGYALYRAACPATEMADVQGILVHDAADVVSVYVDGRYLGTQVPGGTHAYFPLPRRRRITEDGQVPVAVRCETWGHSNFHDPRLPAICLGSFRGMSRLTLVTRRDPLPLWQMEPGGPIRSTPYYSSPGGRLTGQVPARYRSVCTVEPDGNADRHLLWLEGAECPSLVEANGQALGWVDRYHPTIDLGNGSTAGVPLRLSLAPQKWYAGESAGRAHLVLGRSLSPWTIARVEEAQLARSAGALRQSGRPVRPPLRLDPGDLAWMHGSLRPDGRSACHALVLRGRNLKVSVLFNGHLVGRIFLPSPMRPKMAGGRDDAAYLPACWFKTRGNHVDMLLEAVGEQRGRLDSVEIEPVG